MAKKRKPFYVAKERHAHVPVYKCYQRKKGKTYKYFSVADLAAIDANAERSAIPMKQ